MSAPSAPHLDLPLGELDLLPTNALATYVVGSTARGWAHGTSDTDLVVVSAEPIAEPHLFMPVPLDPDTVPVAQFSHDGRRFEVKYWLDRQVDQLFDKISWSTFAADHEIEYRLAIAEQVFCARLMCCVPLSGQDWIEQRRRQLTDSAFRSIMIGQALAEADDAIKAAVGQLAAGNAEDAVLLARTAFESVAEALLFDRGDYEAGPKWRARRFRTAAPEHLTFERYWSIQSMRTFDPMNPERWVTMVIELCQQITLEIEL